MAVIAECSKGEMNVDEMARKVERYPVEDPEADRGSRNGNRSRATFDRVLGFPDDVAGLQYSRHVCWHFTHR